MLDRLKVLLLDCQTTGANPRLGHLLEIAWSPYRATQRSPLEVRSFLIRLPPGSEIPPRICRLTGILPESQVDAVPPNRVAEELQEVMVPPEKGHPLPLVIHFAQFEHPFLEDLLSAGECRRPDGLKVICTHQIAIRLFPELPRRGIRALAGYLGHGMPELKRSGDHVRATAVIWKELVENLGRIGIRTPEQLSEWMNREVPVKFPGREYPFVPDRRALPESPGIYRMKATGGRVLYVGKAKSLKSRVSSYFRKRTRHPEHILEMLCQVRGIEFSPTGSELEAALQECREIQQRDPPYNRALRRSGRQLVFFSADLLEEDVEPSLRFPIGPVPQSTVLRSYRLLREVLEKGEDLDPSAAEGAFAWSEEIPDGAMLLEAAQVFRERFGHLIGLSWPRSLVRIRRAVLDERAALEAQDGDEIDAPSHNSVSGTVRLKWTVESLCSLLEGSSVHAGLLLLRAQWFRLISESTLRWRHSGEEPWTCLVFHEGLLASTGGDGDFPVPRGFRRSPVERMRSLDLGRYDLLRVLTTEMKRLVTAGASLELRTSPSRVLRCEQLSRILARL